MGHLPLGGLGRGGVEQRRHVDRDDVSRVAGRLGDWGGGCGDACQGGGSEEGQGDGGPCERDGEAGSGAGRGEALSPLRAGG